jgi:hypothetical protein
VVLREQVVKMVLYLALQELQEVVEVVVHQAQVVQVELAV